MHCPLFIIQQWNNFLRQKNTQIKNNDNGMQTKEEKNRTMFHKIYEGRGRGRGRGFYINDQNSN